MKLAIVMFIVLASSSLAQDSINEWRLATTAEHKAEIAREYKAMDGPDFHISGDPPCTMGEARFSDGLLYDKQPCALINSKGVFTDLVEIEVGKHKCRITSDQEWAVIKAVGPDKDGTYNFGIVFDACRDGKLPVLVLKGEPLQHNCSFVGTPKGMKISDYHGPCMIGGRHVNTP
jgi:hypothetical protein